jgi:hypothetical protein
MNLSTLPHLKTVNLPSNGLPPALQRTNHRLGIVLDLPSSDVLLDLDYGKHGDLRLLWLACDKQPNIYFTGKIFIHCIFYFMDVNRNYRRSDGLGAYRYLRVLYYQFLYMAEDQLELGTFRGQSLNRTNYN